MKIQFRRRISGCAQIAYLRECGFADSYEITATGGLRVVGWRRPEWLSAYTTPVTFELKPGSRVKVVAP